MKDTRNAAGLIADGEYLAGARYALDYDQDTSLAIAASLIAIAEMLELARNEETGCFNVYAWDMKP